VNKKKRVDFWRAKTRSRPRRRLMNMRAHTSELPEDLDNSWRNIMIRRMTLACISVSIVALVSSGVVRAHEGHDHKIMGTVTMAAPDHVMLKDQSGKDVTVQVSNETRVKSTPAMKVEEIKPGTRVVITATQEKDKSFKAKVIEVGAATK